MVGVFWRGSSELVMVPVQDLDWIVAHEELS